MQIGAHAFDGIEHFFDSGSRFPEVRLVVAEDNEAVIKILQKGRSGKLRHVARTHRVNIDWLFEALRDPGMVARYCRTDYQTADISTKAITKPETWNWPQRLMMIKPHGPIGPAEAAAPIGTNKQNMTMLKTTCGADCHHSSYASSIWIQWFLQC